MVKAFLSIKVQLVTILLNWIPILGFFQTYNMSRRNLSQTIMSLSSDTNRNMAAEIMDRFSLRTGVLVDSSSGDIPESRRYLWTDSFALCNYLSLSEYASSTKDTRGENHFTTCAERIVKLVHQDLGRFKSDDASKLSEVCGLVSFSMRDPRMKHMMKILNGSVMGSIFTI